MPELKVPADVLLGNAARAFSQAISTESAEHIKPFHRYLAMRFVIEGGFHPTDIRPRPPLMANFRDGNWYLSFEPDVEDEREQIVLGALKSKRIDLVVSKEGIGPVLAVSVKGTIRAFRNLVNRTEEAIGDCANIHIMYPGLVYGFVHFLKATDPNDRELKPNDKSVDPNGDAVPAIKAYAKILEGLAGRRLVRNDYARYEGVGLALVKTKTGKRENPLLAVFPTPESPLTLNACFAALYQTYDLRFPYTYTDPILKHLIRAEWHADSPALAGLRKMEATGEPLGYSARTTAG
ncbi:MAG: hypothetical protein HYY65_07725 [Candidatus Tectomicrobia bacterium]|uniref:Uncharacterized protein n=1 Tax=Tectimicrobiota bacterium TaxID=2528274 RepID=A0A932GPY4_UNCTE|nr:hypothetical protein [Candidatus Tectomicrobia bacterium]